jgi:hypothetical protein
MNALNISKIDPTVLSINAGRKYIKSLPDCSEGLIYLVTGPHCWAANINAVKAVKNAKSVGGNGIYTIHRVNEDAQVNIINGEISYNSLATGVHLNMAKFHI